MRKCSFTTKGGFRIVIHNLQNRRVYFWPTMRFTNSFNYCERNGGRGKLNILFILFEYTTFWVGKFFSNLFETLAK